MPPTIHHAVDLLKDRNLREKIGNWLIKLGDAKGSYELEPPARVSGVQPTFGFSSPVVIPGGGLNEYRDAYAVSKYPEGGFYKYHLRPTTQILEDYGSHLPPRNLLSDELTSIDALLRGKLGGAAEYQKLWLDDLLHNRQNFSTYLTKSNLLRRPINQLSFQVRNPEASNVLMYPSWHMDTVLDDQHIPRPTQAEFMQMSPEDRVGWLGFKTTADLLDETNPVTRGLVEKKINPLTFDQDMRQATDAERGFYKESPFGLQSMRRSAITLNAMRDLARGMPEDELSKYNNLTGLIPLYKKYGGVVKLTGDRSEPVTFEWMGRDHGR